MVDSMDAADAASQLPAEVPAEPAEPSPPIEPAVPAAPQPHPAEPPQETEAEAASRSSRRISDLAGKLSAAQAREAEAIEALRRATEAMEAMRKPAEPAPLPDAPRPTREQFHGPDEYEAAVVEWATDRAAKRAMAEFQRAEQERRHKEMRERQEQAQRTEQQRIATDYQRRRAAFMAEHPDYQEIAEAPDVPLSPYMVQAIGRSEHGPRMAYHLGQNHEEAARIAGLQNPDGSPDIAAQIFEMGLLAARVTQPAPPPPPRAAVITPIRGTGPTAVARERTMDEEMVETSKWIKDRQRGGF